MDTSNTRKSWVTKVTVSVAIFFAVVALALNSVLVVSAVDGKRLIDKVETDAGRELTGYELYSEYREVNDYYYPTRKLHGNVLYFFEAFSVPWILASVGSLFVLLRVYWKSTRLRRVGEWALAIMVALLAVVISHWSVIRKIAWAVE